MKLLNLATLVFPLALFSVGAVTPRVALAERSPTSLARTCMQTSNMKLTKDSEGFEDPDHAIQLLSNCLSGWPDAPTEFRAKSLQMRAVAHAQKKDYTRAIADRKESLRLVPPRTGWDIISLASDYREDGQPERAVELLRTMLQNNMGLRGKGTTPGMPSYYHLGRALIAVQHWSSAAEAFSEGMRYQPDYVWAYAYRGLAYDRMEQAEMARADVDKVRSLIRASEPDARERDHTVFREPPFTELSMKYPEISPSQIKQD